MALDYYRYFELHHIVPFLLTDVFIMALKYHELLPFLLASLAILFVIIRRALQKYHRKKDICTECKLDSCGSLRNAKHGTCQQWNDLFKIYEGGCVASKEIQEGTLLFRKSKELIPWLKFKHSCSANTYFVRNENEPTILEFRVVSTIVCGEELTLNWGRCNTFMKNLKFRREYLKDKFGFDCYCDLCEVEEHRGDKDRYELFQNMITRAKKLHQNRIKLPKNYRKGLQTWRQEIACYKEMYKYARECKAIPEMIISNVIYPGIRTTISAYLYAKWHWNENSMLEFEKDCFTFFEDAHKLIEIFSGKESSNQWKKLLFDDYQIILKNNMLYNITGNKWAFISSKQVNIYTASPRLTQGLIQYYWPNWNKCHSCSEINHI